MNLRQWCILLLLCSVTGTNIFPRPGTQRYAYIIASSAGNLPSASRDVVTYTLLFERLGFEIYYIIEVNAHEYTQITTRLGHDINIMEISEVPKRLSQYSNDVDLAITISCHGFTSGTHDYIKFKGVVYTNEVLRTWFSQTHAKTLILVDTCHSGNMCGLDQTRRSESIITSISSCSRSEMDQDDISSEFGFGGGLTTAFADYIGDKTAFEIDDLYHRCQSRLQNNAMHPQMCWL